MFAAGRHASSGAVSNKFRQRSRFASAEPARPLAQHSFETGQRIGEVAAAIARKALFVARNPSCGQFDLAS
jgi:hypothetical protein